jgi:precorrin-6B methylase 2
MKTNAASLSSNDIEQLNLLAQQVLIPLGWFDSFEQRKCTDGEGNPLPWYNYPVIDFLKNRLPYNIKIFEFGAGYSTLFYASLVRKVISVETRQIWIDKITDELQKNSVTNVNLLHIEKNKFAESIKAFSLLDLVVVDSMERKKCIEVSIDCLSESGAIIVDNLEREDLKEGIDFLHASGFKSVIFTGIGPLRTALSKTGIFYRKNNIFNL